MRDIIRFFRQTYRAVRTDGDRAEDAGDEDVSASPLNGDHQQLQQPQQQQQQQRTHRRQRRPLNRGFSIVDVFFNQPKRGRGPRWPKGVFLLKASGLLAILTAIVLFLLQPYMAIFRWKLIFAENGEIFNLWQTPPVELYIKVYLFNITNAEAFMRGDEPKMRVEQVGPYVYREKFVHNNVQFNGNGTLTTEPKHPLVWNEELSLGNREDDMFMLPNIAMLSIAQVASGRSFFFRTPINMVIRQTRSEPIVRMTAKEFMFGYASTITSLGNQLMPDWISFDKVGLIDRMYDFNGDIETVFTGESDSSVSGLIDTYRGETHLRHWHEPHCSRIHMSSDGTKFKSFITPNDTLLFYRKSMCRAQRLQRIGDELHRIGQLSAYRYEFEQNALDNGVYDERNKCFCRTPDTCLQAGLLDVSDCYYGFPIALSYPHFLDADDAIREQVLGSEPNRSAHTTYMMIEPMTGMPLKLSVKMQINLAMHDVSNMAHVERFSNIVLPMLWFEITMPELPPTLRSRFNLYLNILPVVDASGQLLLFTAGVVLVLVAIVRAALLFSRTMQISGSQKRQQQHGKQNRGAYANFGGAGSGGGAGVALTGADGGCGGGAGVDYDVYDDDEDDGDDDYAYDGDDYDADDVVSYEMREKCIRNGDDVILYEVDLSEVSTAARDNAAAEMMDDDESIAFMLENEQALSEDDEEDGGGVYDSDGSSNAAGSAGQPSMSYEDNATVVGLSSLCTENGSFERNDDSADLMILLPSNVVTITQMTSAIATPSPAAASSSTQRQLGTFTSSLEDLGTDDFPDVVLHIDEDAVANDDASVLRALSGGSEAYSLNNGSNDDDDDGDKDDDDDNRSGSSSSAPSSTGSAAKLVT